MKKTTAKKVNGTESPEIIYTGEKRDSDLIAALNMAIDGPPPGKKLPADLTAPARYTARRPQEKRERPDSAILMMTKTGDSEILFVYHGRPSHKKWQGIARYDRKKTGSFEHIAARPFYGDELDVRRMLILEHHAGRGDAWQHFETPKLEGSERLEDVDVDSAVAWHQGQASVVLYVRHRDLWWNVCLLRRAPKRADETFVDEPRLCYNPDIRVV
ncbi:MAG: hypothetical protein RIB59_04460 [Rhodospirillales bacterium]